MDDKSRVRFIFQANEIMVLSTADKSGKPWVTPVGYTFDDENCLYWVSSSSAQHSSNISARPEVAIVIYMTELTRDAIYIDAIAEELVDNKAIINAIKIRNTRPQLERFRVKALADVSGKAAWRIYKATPKAMYFREQSTVEGQSVTGRRETN